MKKGVWLFLFFCVLAGVAFFLKPEDLSATGKMEAAYPHRTEGAWEYPIQPGTEEWVDLGSTKKRREACCVPREALENMDTEALLETALTYPFCLDMLAFDRAEDGYRHQLGHNSALLALEGRSDRHEVTQARLEDMAAWMDEAGRTCSAESAFQYDCLTIIQEYME